jgi:hypothetical protein
MTSHSRLAMRRIVHKVTLKCDIRRTKSGNLYILRWKLWKSYAGEYLCGKLIAKRSRVVEAK